VSEPKNIFYRHAFDCLLSEIQRFSVEEVLRCFVHYVTSRQQIVHREVYFVRYIIFPVVLYRQIRYGHFCTQELNI